MCFCHLNHCADYRAGIRSLYGIAEQPVLAPYCKWTDRILAKVISKAAPPVLQIGLRCITPVENIINGFIHPRIPDRLLLIDPRPESLQNRFFLLETLPQKRKRMSFSYGSSWKLNLIIDARPSIPRRKSVYPAAI